MSLKGIADVDLFSANLVPHDISSCLFKTTRCTGAQVHGFIGFCELREVDAQTFLMSQSCGWACVGVV
jgi:hypothetical protein